MDGKYKYEIINTLQEMEFCAMSYIAKVVSVENAAKLLASRFIA